MVPVTRSFPLFKLPYLALRNVLQTMDKLDLIKASLCSKRMKHAVRSLFPKPNKCRIDIDNRELNIWISGAVVVRVGFQLSDLSTLDPCTMRFYEHPSTTLPTFQNFCLKNWFDHIVGVFHVKSIITLSFKYIPIFELIDLRILRNLIQDLEIFRLHTSLFVRRDQLVPMLDNFPNIQNLRLSIEAGSLPRQLVERKFDEIHFIYSMLVDEILSLKAKFIHVPIQDFEFNKVLKKWVEGWNPLLTGMKLKIRRFRKPDNIFDGVLDGIDHEGPLITENGTKFTIKNSQGISATITFNEPKQTDFWIDNVASHTDVDMLVADHQS